MSYPKQKSVIDRLQDETMNDLNSMHDKRWAQIERLWTNTRSRLRGAILDVYHTYFKDEKWSLVGMKTTGAQTVLEHAIHNAISDFSKGSLALAKAAINDLYMQSILRHSWILDETTPPNFTVRIPHKKKLIESGAVSYYRGAEATKVFSERWESWSDAYRSALLTNLGLGALNQSSAKDAADEVDATRINTPQSDLLDALQRSFDYQAAYAINNAINNVSAVNEDADVTEIWETRRNTRVCDDCDSYEGESREDIPDEIPLHPNCNCYWRLVPKSWADLLKSGNQEDYNTAVLMDAQGLVPSSMVLKDESGKLAGYTTVEFKDWLKDNFYAVRAQ